MEPDGGVATAYTCRTGASTEPCAIYVDPGKFCNVVIMNLSMVLNGARQIPVWDARAFSDLLQLIQCTRSGLN